MPRLVQPNWQSKNLHQSLKNKGQRLANDNLHYEKLGKCLDTYLKLHSYFQMYTDLNRSVTVLGIDIATHFTGSGIGIKYL